MTTSALNAGVPTIREPIASPDTQNPKSMLVTRAWFYFFQTLFNRTVNSGTVLQFAGATVPAGYLATDGSAVSRVTFSALNAVAASVGYGAPYGPGDGVNTFNVPTIAPAGGIITVIKT